MAFNPGIAGTCLIGTAATVGGSLCIGEWDFDEFGGGAEDDSEIKVREKEVGRGYILSEDNEYGNYSNKYGSKYYKHFVGVTKKVIFNNDGTKRETVADDGWKGNYKEYYRQDAEEGFSREIVTDGKKLRDACKTALKGTLNKSTKELASEGSKYKEKEVGEFCSPTHEVPVAIADDEVYETGTIGASNRDKLTSTRYSNDRFGEIKKNIFFGSRNPESQVPAFFKELRKKNIVYGDQPQALRHKCEEAYNKKAVATSTVDSPTQEEVLKYCALEESN